MILHHLLKGTADKMMLTNCDDALKCGQSVLIFCIELLPTYFRVFECRRQCDSASTTTCVVLSSAKNTANDDDDAVKDGIASCTQGNFNKDDANQLQSCVETWLIHANFYVLSFCLHASEYLNSEDYVILQASLLMWF